MKNIILFLICLIFFTAYHSFGQSQSLLPDSAIQKIDSSMNSLMKKNNITGSSIGIVDNGKIVYTKGYGYAEKAKNIRSTSNTIFGIGSTTKIFTAMAIMKLRDESRIDLDKPASYY